MQIVAGFILGGALITVATILIPLQVIIVLSLVLVTILALLTTHDNLKAYRPFMFSIIAGYVVAISFILNTSISKESFPMILS